MIQASYAVLIIPEGNFFFSANLQRSSRLKVTGKILMPYLL